VFRPAETAIAVEVLDEALAGDEDYRIIGAYERGADTLVGYACWGPTPATAGTWDLYWIAVDPAWQGKGIGSDLLEEVERRLATEGGRLLVAETSSRAEYAPTWGFYERRGFRRAAVVPEYYAPGDDLVLYLKDLRHGVLATPAS
jgi:ribosomal protein S18 acetylase RimI-like enzyme